MVILKSRKHIRIDRFAIIETRKVLFTLKKDLPRVIVVEFCSRK